MSFSAGVMEAILDETAEPWSRIIKCDPCSYCGERDYWRPGVGVDHIVPRSSGGLDHWMNLTAACTRCNSSKHDKPLLQYLLYREEVRRSRSRDAGRVAKPGGLPCPCGCGGVTRLYSMYADSDRCADRAARQRARLRRAATS